MHEQAIERAQIDADLAQQRYMMVDPGNRLVADTLESQWNEKLRALATAQENKERYRHQHQTVLDNTLRDRLVAMTTDFQQLWADPATSDRERKRMLAYLIEDVTLVKFQAEGFTKLHVRFNGGRTETLTTLNPKSSAQKVKTPAEIVTLVDQLLDDHIYAEIAELLNEQGLRPGGSARPGCHDARFSATRVAYLVHRYGLRSRYDRLRARGLLTAKELAQRLGVHEHTVWSWAQHGIINPTCLQRSGVFIRRSRVQIRRSNTVAGGINWLIGQPQTIKIPFSVKVLLINRKRCSMNRVSWCIAKTPGRHKRALLSWWHDGYGRRKRPPPAGFDPAAGDRSPPSHRSHV